MLSLGEGRLWSQQLMIPQPTVSDAHIIRGCTAVTKLRVLAPSSQARLHGVSHNEASPMPIVPFVAHK